MNLFLLCCPIICLRKNTVFFYLWPDLQTTSLTCVVYVCFDRRTTALTHGSWCRIATATFHGLFSPVTNFNSYVKLKMKTDVWESKFITFFSLRTAMVLWNPFKKVITNYYIFFIFEVTLSLLFVYRVDRG